MHSARLSNPFLFKENFKTLSGYLQTLSKEKESINKWNVGGQIYTEFIRLNEKADVFFTFTFKGGESDECQQTAKVLTEETYTAIHHELLALSARLKEFDTRTPKKLLCSFHMARLLLKFFNAFQELSEEAGGEAPGPGDEDESSPATAVRSTDRVLSRAIVERAIQQTETIPEHSLFNKMLIKKSQYTHQSLMPKNRI